VSRSWILLVPFLVACGPSAGDPVAESTGDGSSGAASTGDASTSSASGGVETAAAASETTAASDETALPLDELPTEAAGDWLCTGWEDPIFIRLQPGRTMPWEGTACGPDLTTNPPHEWTTCDELGFGHPNLTLTQAYWTFELDYEPFGGDVVSLDLGVDYVPDTDTLEGFLIPNPPPDGFIPETCMRYVER
jgi:hypothetical protein